MIDLYTWSTPNGRKISIMLEELGFDYRVHTVNITKGEQFDEAFLKLSPNNKIPAIVDSDTGQTLFETGAILLYLAEKAGQFVPTEPSQRWRMMEWLMWQMAGFGPMLGQAHAFLKFNPDLSPLANERFAKEATRLYGVLDQRLKENEFVAGDDYTIADIAIWPWVARFQWHQIDLNAYPHVLAWYQKIAARPAVQKGYSVPKEEAIPQP